MADLIAKMSIDIAAWLEELGLGDYADAFAENGVDEVLLPELTNEDLKDLGVARLSDRKRLLKAIVGLSKSDDQADDASTPVTESKGERRQVTVLFADLSGFTQLSSKLDPEATHDLLNRYFKTVDRIVESYGGTIDKHIGDSVMAVFGAPVAHTNDPERAVRAALEIHAAMPRLAEELDQRVVAHIGIASGQVVASGTGSEAYNEYTVTGETVNLASRLDDLAGPGETLISRAVRDSVGGVASCIAKGEISVKGLTRPIEIWSLEQLVERGKVSDHEIFVGRRAEIRQFEALLDEAIEHRQGNSILLRGEPGIGKTRLVEEFGSLADERSVQVHRILILDFGVEKGQASIPALVRSLLSIPVGCDNDDRQRLAEQAISNGLLLENQRVFLNELLDLRQPTQLQINFDAMNITARNAGFQETVVELVGSKSKTSPLLIVIEDIHWADRLTLDHLTKLAAGIAELPVLLVMTTRPEGPLSEQEWIASMRGSPFTMVELQPLRAAEALQLARELAAKDVSHLEAFVERAEGNPLFLEQLTRGAAETSEKGLPDTLQGVVLARMDQLPEKHRVALRAASVLGQRFSLDVLRDLTGDRNYNCDTLIQHRLVRREGEDYIFAHALIQDGIYGSLLKGQKQDLHKLAAQNFAGQDLAVCAQHLDRAEDPTAARAYIEAAKSEQDRFRFERALELAKRGGEIACEAGDQYDALIVQGDILQALGSFGPSVQTFRQALDVTSSNEGRCRALIGEALGLLRTDEHDEAEGRLQEAEKFALSENLVPDLAQISRYRATIEFARGNAEACFSFSEKAVNLAQQCGLAELEANSWSTLADAEQVRGNHLKAMEAYQRCIDISSSHSLRRIELINRKMQADILLYMNDLQGALECYESVIEGVKELGDKRAEFLARGAVAWVYIQMGGLDEAREHIHRARERIIEMDARRFLMNNNTVLANLALAEGDQERARKHLDEAEDVSQTLGIAWLKPWRLGVRTQVARNDAERLEAIASAEAIFAAGEGNYVRFEFYDNAIEGCIAAQDWDTVDRLAKACEEFFGPKPLEGARFVVERARTLAAVGNGKCDPETLEILRRLRKEAESAKRLASIPPIDAALASCSH